MKRELGIFSGLAAIFLAAYFVGLIAIFCASAGMVFGAFFH